MPARDVVRELVTVLGFDLDERKHKKYGALITNFKTKLRAAAVEFGIFAGALGAFTRNVARSGAEIFETSRSLGLSTDALQEWRFAAESAGLAVETMNSSLLSFSRRIGLAASMGTGPAIRAIGMLGLQLRDTEGNIRDTDELLTETFQKLDRITEAQKRNAIAADLFNLSGAQMNKLLENGADGLAELRRQAHRTGGIMDEGLTAQSKKLSQAWLVMTMSLKGLRNRLAKEWLPAMTEGIEKAAKWVRENQALIATLVKMVVAIMALKVVISVVTALGAALALVTAPLTIVIAGLAALALIAQDVYTYLSGSGRSLTGNVVAKVSALWDRGVAAVNKWVTDTLPGWLIDGLSTAWDWVWDSIDATAQYLQDLLGDAVAAVIPPSVLWALRQLKGGEESDELPAVTPHDLLMPGSPPSIGMTGLFGGAGAGGAALGPTVTNTFNITAAPGQTEEGIARAIVNEFSNRPAYRGNILGTLGP